MTTTISMLAIDLAKGSFQVCAIGADGAVLYNRVLSRTRLMTLLAEQSACVVAMEACATVNAVLIFPKSAEVKFPTTAVAAISRLQ